MMIRLFYELYPDVFEFAKNLLKEKMSQCTEEQRKFFVELYSGKNGPTDYKEVINIMNDEQVNVALFKAKNTIEHNIEKF